MLRDRGTIKWTAMMIPEHVKLLREWNNSRVYEQPKSLTEWELEDLQQTIDQAINNKEAITLKVWDGEGYTQWAGYIKRLNYNKREIELETLTSTKNILIDLIHSASLDDKY